MSFVENMEMFYGQSMKKMALVIPVHYSEGAFNHIEEWTNKKEKERAGFMPMQHYRTQGQCV